MPVKVVCPNPDCGASYSMLPEAIARGARCQACGSRFEVADETYDPYATVSSGANGFGSKSPPPTDLPSPFGKYEIVRKLGQGGMGAVYLARDVYLDRLMALKVPHFEIGTNPEVVERFRREARAAASFNHPNFCPIHEVGRVGDTHYLAMAFVEGQTLASLVSRDDPMPPREAARIGRQLALSLAEAHRRGIIHRDLKPANVMVDGRGTLIIMDFGLARRIGDDSDLTRTGVPMGTPQYMSPEQVRGTKQDLGPTTDIYSLGVILYELSTGRRPFEGPLTAIIGAVLHVEPKPPSVVRPGLDAAFEAITLKAMSKSVEARHPSMEALAEALGAYIEPPAKVAPPPRRWRRALLASALLLSLLGVIVYVATDCGTLRVEGVAPGMEVRVDGQEVTIRNVGEPIVVRSGTHGLLVTRGDVVVKAPRSFEIHRGRESVVHVELVAPGEPIKPDANASTSNGTVTPDVTSPPPASTAESRLTSNPREETKQAPPTLSSKIIKPAPNSRESAIASTERGDESYSRKDFDKAHADFEEAIRLDPTYASGYRGRGRCWALKGDKSKAMDDFEEAIRLDPRYAPAYNGRGLCWRAKGDLAKAMADFNETIRLDPKYAPAYNNRGLCWRAQADPAKAMADYDEAIRLDPKDNHAYRNRGDCWRAQGDFAKAIADYDEVIRLDPTDTHAYRNRGLCWKAQGDLAKAVADLDEAIRLDPKFAIAHFNRGLCWQEKGDLAKAIADYEEAFRLDPKYAPAYGNLARVLAMCPDPRYRDGKRAVELAQIACDLDSGKDANTLAILAAAHAEAGQFDEAVRRQQEAIGLTKEELKHSYRHWLNRYEAKQPCRDASMKTEAMMDSPK